VFGFAQRGDNGASRAGVTCSLCTSVAALWVPGYASDVRRCGELGCVIGVSLTLLATPNAALAGPAEQMAQLALHPTDPTLMVLRYMNGGEGLLFTHDAGASWQLACSALFDSGTVRLTSLAFGADGTTLAADSSGVWRDDRSGCGFAREPALDGEWVPDLIVHPSNSKILFAATAGTGMERPSRLARRNADGTWSFAEPSPERLVLRLRAAATADGVRLYESGRLFRQDDDAGYALGAYMIRVSEDEGHTWREHPYAVDDESELLIEAVDPSDPDRIVARRTYADPERPNMVLVSTDQGATFHDYFEVAQLTSVAFLPSGELFLGAAEKLGAAAAPSGLWRARNVSTPPEHLADFIVRCLAYQPLTDTLFACQDLNVGKVDRKSGAFESVVDTKTSDTLVSCPGVDVADQCAQQLCSAWCGPSHFPQAPLCAVYTGRVAGCGCDPSYASAIDGCDVAPPVGAEPAPDAGRAPRKPSVSAHGGGCSCSVLAGGRPSAGPACCAVFTLLALQRRQKTTRSAIRPRTRPRNTRALLRFILRACSL
jgi:hypothetical protein